jgi:hypothetical protein
VSRCLGHVYLNFHAFVSFYLCFLCCNPGWVGVEFVLYQTLLLSVDGDLWRRGGGGGSGVLPIIVFRLWMSFLLPRVRVSGSSRWAVMGP